MDYQKMYMKAIYFWANGLTKRNWTPEYNNKIQGKIYKEAVNYGLSPVFATEWAQLGPWNM